MKDQGENKEKDQAQDQALAAAVSDLVAKANSFQEQYGKDQGEKADF